MNRETDQILANLLPQIVESQIKICYITDSQYFVPDFKTFAADSNRPLQVM